MFDIQLNQKERLEEILKQISKAAGHSQTLDVSQEATASQETLPDINGLYQLLESNYTKKMVLKILHYPGGYDRFFHISGKEHKTFEWIFKDAHASQDLHFLRWLRGKEQHFWLSGKPGSGKSMLMKAIIDDARTTEALKTWAGESKLVRAWFFFWNAGNGMQKSLEGLTRLLYEVYRHCPELIPRNLVQEDMISTNPESSTLHSVQGQPQLLVQALEQSSHNTKFCFFIDGLDEYYGEETDLVKALKQVLCFPTLKLCLSSRDWPAFRTAFGQGERFVIQLHQHTKDDMQLYVQKNLEEEVLFQQMRLKDERYQALISNFVIKSPGVFLWVSLAVREILRGLPNGDTVEDLQRRLNELPSELDEYFRRMLYSIKKILLAIVLQNPPNVSASVEFARVRFLTVICFAFCNDERE